ncbi:hypothetical protein GCE86_06695 [Micromonospora terminaliae]|uniref:Uncharacterized protein n=1 Tax=Micromonospora terminaliae TaxID=1914461 RepID=A0AAJ3DL76_9ACTN|nr:hypothetical protein [Micromonospora terminaliae]NES30063.1 hypothetical protein [Micromonospora terminaliae]QGL46764.1 hypothetical protein GCE86_06695 [Micromonospora terminaliae]
MSDQGAGGQVPDEATVVSLLLAFLRGDMEGAQVIMADTSLPLLLAAALGWFNALGIKEFGADAWADQLQRFLADAARRG